MDAENTFGEMLSQLAMKDAGQIAELTPEQSKLVNTERCFPAIDVIVKFAQENHARHLEKTPDDIDSVKASDTARKWSETAKKQIETDGFARIRGIAVGKRRLQDSSSTGITNAADGKINPLTDYSLTQDLTELYRATGIDSVNRIDREVSYMSMIAQDIPSNHDLLIACLKAKMHGQKGVTYRRNNQSSRWTVISKSTKLPNTICIETTDETYSTVDNRNGNGSTSVLTGQTTSFDLVCFSDAEWERAQLTVDKPDYAARYAYLKSKLLTNDQGEPSLREVEQNVAVNGDLALRGEISLRDAKLPALVSAPEGKFIAWRNPARAGQIELIPTTSKDLVERVILSGGDPSAAIKRLQKLDISDNTTREAIRPTSPQDAEAQYRLKAQIDTLRQAVVGSNFNIRVPTPSGMQLREAMIKGVSLGTDNKILVNMEYKSSAGGWKSIQPLVVESPDLVVMTIRTTFPQFGNFEIEFV